MRYETTIQKQNEHLKNPYLMGKSSAFSTGRKIFYRPLSHHLRKHLHQNKGQVTVELILLGVVLIILSQLVINQIKTNDYIKDFAKGPSQVVANMMANGNWKKNPAESKAEHPNIHEKHYSWDPL